MIKVLILIISLSLFICCKPDRKNLNKASQSIETSGNNIDSIVLVQVAHPYLGHRLGSSTLDNIWVANFISDFSDKHEEIIKFYSCYVIKIFYKDGHFISYRTNGKCFEKFKDNNESAIYFKLNKNINIITKYWGLPEGQFCNTTPENILGNKNYKTPWIDVANFDSLTVSQFVEMLKIKGAKEHNKLYVLTIGGQADSGWIKEIDLKYLIAQINSTAPSYCVMQNISSQMPNINNTSTIGGQVMNLIDAFRFKKQYPYFLTSCEATNETREGEIMKWWESRNKNGR
jgi:hypothetical protein